MISVYFFWFGYWTLKEWKTVKVQNHFDVQNQVLTFTAATFIFFCEIPKYV